MTVSLFPAPFPPNWSPLNKMTLNRVNETRILFFFFLRVMGDAIDDYTWKNSKYGIFPPLLGGMILCFEKTLLFFSAHPPHPGAFSVITTKTSEMADVRDQKISLLQTFKKLLVMLVFLSSPQ